MDSRKDNQAGSQEEGDFSHNEMEQAENVNEATINMDVAAAAADDNATVPTGTSNESKSNDNGLEKPCEEPCLAQDREKTTGTGTDTSASKGVAVQALQPPPLAGAPVEFATAPFPTEPSRPSYSSVPGAHAVVTFRPSALESSTGIRLQERREEVSPQETVPSCSGEAPEDASGLAVANPVAEDLPLPFAEPCDQDEEERVATAKRRRKIACLSVGGLVCLVVIIGILGLVLGLRGFKEEEPTNPPAYPPTPAPTLSLTGYITSLLPNYTLEAMSEDPDSPQSLAYSWMVEDPALATYPEWRIRQRFALATFFYATGGLDHWFNSTHWLDYDHHECAWYAMPFCTHDPSLCPPIPYPNPCQLPDPYNPPSQSNEGGGSYKYVWQWNNGLAGSLPPELFWGLTSLQSVSLNINPYLTGSIPSTIGLLSRLNYFTCGLAGLTGSVPTEIGSMTNLLIWVTARNDMSGSLPSELGQLSNSLLRIHMDENPKLTGTLPTQFGQLAALEDLQIYGTQLSATIPTEFGLLSNLTIWDMSANQLTGSLPSELGQLSRIQVLRLRGNDLSGTVPLDMGALASTLKTANVTGNARLSGTIPSNFCGPPRTLLAFDCLPPLLCGCDCPCVD